MYKVTNLSLAIYTEMLLKRIITICLVLGLCYAFEEVKQVENEEEIITNDRETETEDRVSNILEVSMIVF